MRPDRRTFVQSALVAGAGAAVWPFARLGAAAEPQAKPARSFRLAYAPHFGMFQQHAGPDLVAQLEFMAAEGFTALEDNDMRGRPVEVQERIGQTLTRLNMRMGVFVAHAINWTEPTLTIGATAARDKFLAEVTGSVDVARRVNAKWMTVVPGHIDRRLHIDYQSANVIETLKRAAAILEPHGLVIVLEPLNTLREPSRDVPDDDAAGVLRSARRSGARRARSCSTRITSRSRKGISSPTSTAAWDEIAYFQVGDNPGRNEPGTGEVNYRNVFKHIHGRGFKGVVGMEHGNSQRGREGERAVIDAYIAADSF